MNTLATAILAWEMHGGSSWGYPAGGVGLLVIIVVVVLLLRR
jgi:hypothetical protein